MTAASPDGLAVAYAHAVDTRDAATLATLFAHGARVLVPAGLTAPGAAATAVEPGELLAPLQRWTRTRHVVLQQRIDVDGDTARGECYGEAHHVAVSDGGARDLVLHLRYHDRFARTGNAWVFTSRQLVVDWSERREVTLWP